MVYSTVEQQVSLINNVRSLLTILVPGHYQQGLHPSPLDRVRALRMAARCIDFFEKYKDLGDQSSSAAVIGIRGGSTVFTPIDKLLRDETNLEKRIPTTSWWQPMRKLVDILSGKVLFHDSLQMENKAE